jgi:hypothetical protein
VHEIELSEEVTFVAETGEPSFISIVIDANQVNEPASEVGVDGIVNVHAGLVLPAHGPLDHDTNRAELSGAAVSVTLELNGKLPEHPVDVHVRPAGVDVNELAPTSELKPIDTG